MRKLTKNDILKMHSRMIKASGGTPGIRDNNLLDSALQAPFQTFVQIDLYPTIQEKAVRLGYGLIKNHAMFDGNKRLGTHVMLVTLSLNGITLNYTQTELEAEILNVANGNLGYDDLLMWVLMHQDKLRESHLF